MVTSTQLVQLAIDWRGTLPEGGVMAEQKIDGFRAARFAGVTGRACSAAGGIEQRKELR